METVTLGSTNITVNKNGFGALPIQRISAEDAVKLARKAFDAGITFLTRQDFIQTARRNWVKHLRGSESRSIWQPRQRRQMRTNSGSSLRLPCII